MGFKIMTKEEIINKFGYKPCDIELGILNHVDIMRTALITRWEVAQEKLNVK